MNKAKQGIKNSEVSEIWRFSSGVYKGYTEDIKVAKRIMNWISVEQCSIYYYPDFRLKGYDFIFPTRSYNRVSRVLGLSPRRKSPSKILQGKKLQIRNQRLHLRERGAQVISSKLTSVGV
ncbi:MAG: hypothetical protein IIB40_10980 [Candidatus Marinimicrobia bacterium]|nr:hypothetical protein [Candidatus Neomarinimicrobiota bacterium]